MLSHQHTVAGGWPEKLRLRLFYGYGLLLLLIVFITIYSENYLLLLIPAAVLFLYLCVNDLKFIYLLLLFTIPLSVEVALPGGFATDFPTELLIGGLMILFIPYVLSTRGGFDLKFLAHPLIFFLLLYYFWTIVSMIFSSNFFVSAKFALAKTWYIVTFVFVTAVMIQSVNDFKKAFWCVLLPLLFTILYTLLRHWKDDFEFLFVNTPMRPFFRNHVSYACTIAQFIPFTLLAISWYKKGTFKKRFLLASLGLLLVAVYFAYTRSAWLALLAAALAWPLFYFRLMRLAAPLAIAAAVAFFVYMGYHGNYLNHAPDYETTVYHPELADHLASTFEGKDVSSAERIYRWVAGVRMWTHEPWVGFGPGNFFSFYKAYTVNSFETWVSGNPERSSIHNYFLLMLCEQGLIGLLIFIALTLAIMIYGERIYHQSRTKEERRYVMAILLCMVIIYVNTFLSDLIETDKIGSFFFIGIALLVNQELRNRKPNQRPLPAAEE
jgi:O-antigen ligase